MTLPSHVRPTHTRLLKGECMSMSQFILICVGVMLLLVLLIVAEEKREKRTKAEMEEARLASSRALVISMLDRDPRLTRALEATNRMLMSGRSYYYDAHTPEDYRALVERTARFLDAVDNSKLNDLAAFDEAHSFYEWCNAVHIDNLRSNLPDEISISRNSYGMWMVKVRTADVVDVMRGALLPGRFVFSTPRDKLRANVTKDEFMLALSGGNSCVSPRVPEDIEYGLAAIRNVVRPKPYPQGYYMFHPIGPEEGFTTRAKAQAFLRDYKREEARNA